MSQNSNEKKKAVVHVQTKMTEEEYEPLNMIINDLGLKQSAVVRALLISRTAEVELPVGKPKELERILFLINKTSNNINQIAKRLNEANKQGVVSEKVFNGAMNALLSISSSLKVVLKNAS